MKWLDNLLAHFLPQPPRVDPTDRRARRQWARVRDTDKVLREYRKLDVVLKLDVRHRH